MKRKSYAPRPRQSVSELLGLPQDWDETRKKAREFDQLDEKAQYNLLRSQLPQALTPEELSRYQLDGYPFDNPKHMLIKWGTLCRGGEWHAFLIFIHQRGVLGSDLLPGGRQHRDDARHMAKQMMERMMERNEKINGVRNRGYVRDPDPDELEMDDDAPCPPA